MARLGIIATFLLVAGSSYATTIHVPADQPTIQAGIDAASNGDTVLVAPGTYVENINFGSRNIVLASDYLPSKDTIYTVSTIIDGDNANSVVTISGGQDSTAKICGFTIRNGNSSTSSGGGISCGGSAQPFIEHNIIEDNHWGGGITAYSANPRIQYNIIRNNVSGQGGGIYCYLTSATIRNNLIVGNQASYGGKQGGGIFYYYSTCAIENNTIVNNSADSGGGIYYFAAATSSSIRNNIIWGNSCDQIYVHMGSPVVTYCDVQGWAGTGNIDADPLFMNPGGGDFHLQSTSPCINAGDPNPAYNDPDHTRNDMGAYSTTHVPTVIRVPSEQPTIQAGIDAALYGDTVLVADGTYTGDGNRDIDFGGKAIIVRSENGPEATVIDCQGSEIVPHRGFIFQNGERASAVIRGFTITDGTTSWGSGGGGVFCLNASPTIMDCSFLSNVAGQAGGGGIRCQTSSPSVVDCYFENNSSIHNGGAIFGTYMSSPYLLRCTFRLNTAPEGGAAKFYSECHPTFVDCVVSENSAEVGGGIELTYESATGSSFDSCVFYSNSATVYGGAISCNGSDPTFNQCTIAGNSAPKGSGVFVFSHSFPDFHETIIASNLVGIGLECELGSDDSFVLLNCCDVHGNVGGDWVGCIADQYGQNGNISLDPLFCDTANGDYSLFNFSPCAAANNSCGQLIGAFDVGCSLEGTVALASEADTVHVLGHTPEVFWSWLPKAGFVQSEFEIEVGTDNDWAVAEMWDPEVFVSADTQVVYAGAELLDGATYYVHLRTKLNGIWTPWYETSFRMNSLPSGPMVASPLSGTITGDQPTLYVHNSEDAEGDPLLYQFEVYLETNTPELVTISDLIPEQTDSTGWTVTVPLTDNATYRWHGRAWDGYEYSEWSITRFFSVNTMPQEPTNPSLIAPLGENLILYDMLPVFSWTRAIDPDPGDRVHYRLELSLNQNFTMVVPFDNLTQTSYQLADSLLFDTHYWWRVKSIDLTQLSGISEPADFWSWTLGDVSHDHEMTLGDIMILVDHLFLTGISIDPPKVGDVNHDCETTLGDIMLMVDNLFISGAELLVGCE